MVDHGSMACGRIAHDPARYAAVPWHLDNSAELAHTAPKSLGRNLRACWTPLCYDNNVLPVCTVATTANIISLQFFLKTGSTLITSIDAVVSNFSAITGCQDDDAAIIATGGARILDVLDYSTTKGFQTGQQTPAALVPARIAHDDIAGMQHAIFNKGAVSIGVALSQSDKVMDVWDTVAPLSSGDPTPGSWALHNCFIADYDGNQPDDRVLIGTWGIWKVATWRWVTSRLVDQEAYSLSSVA